LATAARSRNPLLVHCRPVGVGKTRAVPGVVVEKWADSERVARWRVAATQIVELRSYKRANRRRAKILFAEICAEVVAVGTLAGAVAIIVADATSM
jgi:hypothetical protein